jgi:hypothetical protein
MAHGPVLKMAAQQTARATDGCDVRSLSRGRGMGAGCTCPPGVVVTGTEMHLLKVSKVPRQSKPELNMEALLHCGGV